jgi:hypothetical protein
MEQPKKEVKKRGRPKGFKVKRKKEAKACVSLSIPITDLLAMPKETQDLLASYLE